MIPEILQVMEERKQKHNQVLYRDLNKKVRRLCNKPKKAFLSEECALMEQGWSLETKEAHERISVVTGKKRCSSSIKGLRNNDDGQLVFEEQDMLHRWKEYIRELLSDPDGKSMLIYFTEKH